MTKKEMIKLTQAFLGVTYTVAATAVYNSWPKDRDRVTSGRWAGIAEKIAEYIKE